MRKMKYGVFKISEIVLLPLLAGLLCQCTANWGCEEKSIPKNEETAVYEFIKLNGLDSIKPVRIANQFDVEGCETGHIVAVTASEMEVDTVPPSISNLIHLERLALSGNNLKSLPSEITKLNPYAVNIRGNKICSASVEIAEWLSKRDSTWSTFQECN